MAASQGREKRSCGGEVGAPKRARMDRDRQAPLASEIVRRDRPDDVNVSLQFAAALRPDARRRWLDLALDAIRRVAVRPSDVYDVVIHPRFASGLTPSMASRMLTQLQASAKLFPPRLERGVLDGSFDLAKLAASTVHTANAAPIAAGDADAKASAAAEMLARCVDFVRSHEGAINEAHERDARTFHARLHRDGLQQAWGMAWARAAFTAKRRVLEGVVPGSPADAWNRSQASLGARCLQPGDELVAVDGLHDWDSMGRLKDMTDATLTFLGAVPDKPLIEAANAGEAPGAAAAVAAPVAASTSEGDGGGLKPPSFASGGYAPDASGSGWWGHADGEWLYNEADKVYFHLSSKQLFMQDSGAPGRFSRLGEGNAAAALPVSADSDRQEQSNAPRELHGRLRWFSSKKGFGFLRPWPEYPSPASFCSVKEGASIGADGSAALTADLFVHWSEVLGEASNARTGDDERGEAVRTLTSSEPPTLVPGLPVRYELALTEEGKLCAADLRVEEDLSILSLAGGKSGAAGRCIAGGPAIQLRDHAGRSCGGSLLGAVAGLKGSEGAEFVALHLPRHVASCFHRREQGGERGASAALAAALRQTQQGFIDYARRLSDNSARAWLASETVACVALVFGPEADGFARALVGTVGGGRALVVRRDGSTAEAMLAATGAGEPEALASATGTTRGEDASKAFDRSKGLKGPAISFPSYYEARGRAHPCGRPRGFGAHAWSQKDGGSAGLEMDLRVLRLNWEEDVALLVASDDVWDGLRARASATGSTTSAGSASSASGADAEAARLVLRGLRSAPSATEAPNVAASAVLDAAGARSAGGAGAVAVMRFAWCELADMGFPEDGVLASSGKQEEPQVEIARSGSGHVVDDMFAMPEDTAASQAATSAIPVVDVDVDDGNASSDSDVDDLGPATAERPQAGTATADESRGSAGIASCPAAPDLDDMFAEFCQAVGT
eukprot:TRINITY_DN5125_c0_g2_i1.p1 TRINITY_DN5125_c0_g2~~TRINITY_DN5125_c0_g2_i1.p1  ORF type:complete len:961 (-),score=189.30 TRINITY_DN5125_c0_g2_i1:83-2965(-)